MDKIKELRISQFKLEREKILWEINQKKTTDYSKYLLNKRLSKIENNIFSLGGTF